MFYSSDTSCMSIAMSIESKYLMPLGQIVLFFCECDPSFAVLMLVIVCFLLCFSTTPKRVVC